VTHRYRRPHSSIDVVERVGAAGDARTRVAGAGGTGGARRYFGAMAASTWARTRASPSLAVTFPSQISFRLLPR
jgi:hypothetical protein